MEFFGNKRFDKVCSGAGFGRGYMDSFAVIDF
jgi:hypothetical protein